VNIPIAIIFADVDQLPLGDDHDRDADIVHPQQLDVQAV